MSNPASKAASGPDRLMAYAWWVSLIAALALLWAADSRRIERVEALTDMPAWSVDAPERDGGSPTGYANGQRRLIVPGHHDPSYWWIREAQLTVAQGDLRLRRIEYDAVPEGREIGRTAPYRWWLIVVGWLRGIVTGESLGFSIERGAFQSDPVLHAILLAGGTLYVARFFSHAAAAVFAIAAISLFPLAANFQPGAPDPHSLSWVLALGSLLPIVAALSGGRARAPAHFIAAGVLGGVGFWNDAVSQAPVLIGISLGAVCFEFIRTRRAARGDAVALPWRSWALSGALTTLAASVFEFAPGHLSWSLSAVNPIHAVTWWGAGELIRSAGEFARVGRAALGRRALVLLGAAGIAVLWWPAVSAMNGTGGLTAPDFYALELANHPSGGIAAGLGTWFARAGAGSKWAVLLPCVILFGIIVRAVLGRHQPDEIGRHAFILAASLVTLVLASLQLRWWNLVDVFLLAGLAVFLGNNSEGDRRGRVRAVFAAAVALPGLFVGFPQKVEREDPDVSQLEAQGLVERDFGYWIAKRGTVEPTVLYSTPIFASAAAFYGGFDSVVSSDHDNRVGNLTAVRIASAVTEQEISVLVRTRKITHVALPLWDPALEHLVRIGHNIPAGQPLRENSFAVSLQLWDMPVWMRPMDYLIPSETRFAGLDLRAFIVVPEQEPDLALSRLADFFVERGQLGELRDFRKSLEAYPRSVPALAAMARIDLALREGVRLAETLETLTPLLSRRAGRNLPPDRRISLATLFIQTKQGELAREQIETCMDEIDVDSLKAMTPGTVINLIALSASLGVPFRDAMIEETAIAMTPPAVRTALERK